MIIHIVKPNETVGSIARLYGVSPQRIITDNGLNNQPYLVVGQALIILVPDTVHTVRQGETPSSIAALYGITEMQLMQRNPSMILNGIIYTGEQLVISYRDEGTTVTNVYGFTYTDTTDSVLKKALPYISSCAVFGYGFTAEGELIEVTDRRLVDLIYSNKAAPIMLITSLTESGNFDNTASSLIFNNRSLQDKVINNILENMREKGYLGLDIDFEYIDAGDRDAFSEFVRNVTKQLNAEGFTVNVDLAPKVSGEQSGSLYEGHDYAALGAAANTVLIMTYEWGYTYGPPMAVAPINEVRRVVQYAVSEIENSKIYMGVPNYGYDWRLPYQRGVTRAVGIGNETAVRIAAENGAEIKFDERTETPYFEYNARDGSEHVVWFEDVRSISAKLELVDEFNLRGPGYWNLINPFSQNWAYLGNKYDIAKLE